MQQHVRESSRREETRGHLVGLSAAAPALFHGSCSGATPPSNAPCTGLATSQLCTRPLLPLMLPAKQAPSSSCWMAPGGSGAVWQTCRRRLAVAALLPGCRLAWEGWQGGWRQHPVWREGWFAGGCRAVPHLRPPTRWPVVMKSCVSWLAASMHDNPEARAHTYRSHQPTCGPVAPNRSGEAMCGATLGVCCTRWRRRTPVEIWMARSEAGPTKWLTTFGVAAAKPPAGLSPSANAFSRQTNSE